MTRQIINTGTTANDGTGDFLRDWALKSNANFAELYAGLDPLDMWTEVRYAGGTVAGLSTPLFAAAAIASGTVSNQSGATLTGTSPFGTVLTASASANSGVRVQSPSVSSLWFGGGLARKFRCQYQPASSFTNRLVRSGYLDTTDQNDATDGAYFEFSGSTVSAKTANNGSRTTVTVGLPAVLSTVYTEDIESAPDGSSVRFRLYAGNNATPAFDQTITTNIPTSSGRAFGAGIVATSNNLAVESIGVLYLLGEGTLNGFLRARGGW